MTTAERRKDETEKAFTAFLTYAQMGPERSMDAVAKKLSKSLPLMKRWSRRHEWQKRVTEYDAERVKISHESEEDALKKEAAFWAKAQIEYRKKAHQVAEALLGVAIKELDKIRTSPRVTTLGDVSRTIQIADNLKRLTLNLPTEKTEHAGPENTPLVVQQAAPVVIVLEPNERDVPAS